MINLAISEIFHAFQSTPFPNGMGCRAFWKNLIIKFFVLQKIHQ